MDTRPGGLVALTSFAYSVTPTVHALGEARHEVTTMLEAEGWGLEDVQAACLVVTELVANALEHGEPPFALSGWVDGRAMLEVVDHATDRMPRLRGNDMAGNGGLGLGIVSQLCDAWGYEVRDGLKLVWCQLLQSASPEDQSDAHGDEAQESVPGSSATNGNPSAS